MDEDDCGTGEPRRRPGRPRKSEDEHERSRAAIVGAVEQVLAAHRYRDVTVTRVIQTAGITRAAFYRSFRNVEEPLGRLVEEAAAELLADLRTSVAGSGGSGSESVVAALDAFLGWSRRHRAVLSAFVSDGRDETSPVHAVREEVMDALIVLVEAEFAATGRPVPPRAVLDVFVTSVEYTAHRIGADGGAADPDQARDLVVRLAAALLGSPDSIQRLAQALRVAAQARTPAPED